MWSRSKNEAIQAADGVFLAQQRPNADLSSVLFLTNSRKPPSSISYPRVHSVSCLAFLSLLIPLQNVMYVPSSRSSSSWGCSPLVCVCVSHVSVCDVR